MPMKSKIAKKDLFQYKYDKSTYHTYIDTKEKELLQERLISLEKEFFKKKKAGAARLTN